MIQGNVGKYRNYFMLVVAIAILSGIFRLLDAGNIPYDGYQTDGNNTVLRVEPGGPAERAGLKVGDRIRSIGGIPVEDTRARLRQPRPRIGQEASLIVERQGQSPADATSSHNLRFAHAAPPWDYPARNAAAFLIGLCFLLCALAAHLKSSGRGSRILVLAAFCFGAAFMGVPYLPYYSLRMLAQALLGIILIFGFAALLHFTMEFPKPKSILSRRHSVKAVYGPAVFIAMYLLFLLVIQPPFTSSLNQLSNLLFGLFIAIYFGGAAIALLHSYARATSRERAQYGLHFVMAGILVGVLPVTISALVRAILPKLLLPGSDFYYLTMIFIPVSLVLAVLRQQREQGSPLGAH